MSANCSLVYLKSSVWAVADNAPPAPKAEREINIVSKECFMLYRNRV